MSKVVILERDDKKTGYKYCYAEIFVKRKFWFPKMLYKTPEYPAFAMLITALADFDMRSKIMDITKQHSKTKRAERRRTQKALAKDLMKD